MDIQSVQGIFLPPQLQAQVIPSRFAYTARQLNVRDVWGQSAVVFQATCG